MSGGADLVTELRARFPGVVGEPVEFRGERTVTVARERLRDVCLWLRDTGGFDVLTDLSGVDHYDEEPRFAVDYLLYALARRERLRLEVRLPAADPVVDSVVTVWRGADWHEREAFDMYGIRFTGHPGLCRILMWDGYPHHPLRKDFPLAGLPAELPATAVGAGQAGPAPMLGGPFVPGTGTAVTIGREPQASDTLAEQTDRRAEPNRKEPV